MSLQLRIYPVISNNHYSHEMLLFDSNSPINDAVLNVKLFESSFKINAFTNKGYVKLKKDLYGGDILYCFSGNFVKITSRVYNELSQNDSGLKISITPMWEGVDNTTTKQII